MIHLGSQRGTTLIEMLVATALSSVVLGGTLTALDVFQSNNRTDVLRNEAQDNARNSIDRLARDLRSVAAPKSEKELPGALEQAEPYSIVFQTIDPAAGIPMRVRYCLDYSTVSNEVLWRQVRKWGSGEATPALPANTACPDATAGDWGTSTKIASYLVNRNNGKARKLFKYGPTGYSEVNEIITVEPKIYISVNPTQTHPGESELKTTIALRNGNRQPIAAFTPAEKNGHVLLNASASYDPDGLALTYKWTEGATTLSTAQQYETPNPPLGSKSVHTYTLEVTDPGGLSAKTSKSIEIK